MSRYRSDVFLAYQSGALLPAPGYKVKALRAGGFAASSQVGVSAIGVEPGHGFKVGDKIMLLTGTTPIFRGADSIQAITIVGGIPYLSMLTNYSVNKGDVILNLGQDTSANSNPNFDDATTPIYADQSCDPTLRITAGQAIASAAARYEYFTPVGRTWEVLLDPSKSGIAAYMGHVKEAIPAQTAFGWFDVTAYGAIADSGTTDNTSAIRSAFADAVAAGGVLYFPPAKGYYGITDYIGSTSVVVSGLTILARGATIKFMSHFVSNGRMLRFESGSDSNIRIIGGTWDGNKAVQGSYSDQHPAIFAANVNGFDIEEATFQNCMGPGVWFYSQGTGNPCQHVRIDGCNFSSNGCDGVRFRDIVTALITRCHFESNVESGITATTIGASGHVKDFRVINNYFGNNGSSVSVTANSVRIVGTYDSDDYSCVEIIGNTIRNSPGIMVAAMRGVEIVANIVRDPIAAFGTSSIGIYAGGCIGVTMKGNVVVRPTAYGLYLDYDSTYYNAAKGGASIEGNVIADLTQSGSMVYGIALSKPRGVRIVGNVLQNESSTINTTGMNVVGDVAGGKPAKDLFVAGNHFCNLAYSITATDDQDALYLGNTYENMGSTPHALFSGASASRVVLEHDGLASFLKATGPIAASELRASGDSSGLAGYNSITGTIDETVGSAGTVNVKCPGATTRNTSGWMKVYVNGVAAWVPYCKSITG